MAERAPRIGIGDAVLAAVAGLAVVAIWGVQLAVVPSFVAMFEDFGSTGELPWITQVVIERQVALVASLVATAAGLGGLALRASTDARAARPLLVVAMVVPLLVVPLQIYGLYAPVIELSQQIR